MSEYDGTTSSHGNDALSSEELELKWGFNLSDDISIEETLSFFHAVAAVFGRLNILKAIEFEEEGRSLDALTIKADFRENGMPVARGYLSTSYYENYLQSAYLIRMQPLINLSDARYFDLELRFDKR